MLQEQDSPQIRALDILIGAELGSPQLLCEEGGTPHSYKKPVDGLTVFSRRS